MPSVESFSVYPYRILRFVKLYKELVLPLWHLYKIVAFA